MDIIDQIANTDHKTAYIIIGGFILVMAMVILREILFVSILATVAVVLYMVFFDSDIDMSSLPKMDKATEMFDDAKESLANAKQKFNDLKEKLPDIGEKLGDNPASKKETAVDEVIEELEKQSK